MPWGLVVVGALSFVVYRRARGAGRSPITMVVLLWLAMLGGMMLASLPGYVAVAAGTPFEVLPLLAIAGGLVGSGWVIRQAGRPRLTNPAEKEHGGQ
jgi:hypothetical protein